MIEPIKIFYCYAPQDRKLRDELEKQLMSLKRLGQITLRLNREILAGTNWSHVEDRRFQAADLILLLISPDFIHSDYHYGIEMHHALEKHEAGNVRVIPIILRPTALWEKTPIGRLQALPKDGKAITERRNRETAFVDVVKEISEVVGVLLTRKQELAFATNVGEGEFPKFTQVIGPLCITCGARNPLGVITCENCGDLLFTDTAKSSQEVHSPHPSSDDIAEMPFFSSPAMPDLTDKPQSPTKASEEEVLVCPNCGTNYLPDEQFCSNCSAYLDSSPADVPVATNFNPGGASNVGSITLTPGTQLENGRYVIEKVLGQGGMGAALLAKDTRVSNKPVVIKELISEKTDPAERQEDVRNFEREVETLVSLDHPLIPNVTASFQEGSRYFMVQEYVAGENLEDRIERLKQPLPEQEVLTYASQVLDVLNYLEQQHPPIVHRDIKPANIIISSKNKRAYVVDFGIARTDKSIIRADKSISKQTSAVGTPGYAPPEQYEGNADPRSDLYALAAMLHHLLTNRDPRNYPLFVYPSVRSLHPKLSPEIEHVLNRALIIDITKRYQNAPAMKHDIDEILMQRFGVDHTSTYTFGIPGPIGATGTAVTQTALSRSSRSPNTSIPPSVPSLFLRILSKASEEEVLVCPDCGTNYPLDEQFCSNCGAYLASSPADAPVATNVNLGGATNAGVTTPRSGSGDARTLTLNAQLENGRYVVVKALGEGGMGATVLAKDTPVSNKLVVIKELLSDNADPARGQEDVRNFELEVETLAHLDHPLIPTVTDSFQGGSHYFMVQEYVPGENLESYMDRVNKSMPERVALGYASQVLDILDYLEQQTPPIVHRDIKPANIIVSNRDKHAHLVDFGIARAQANKNVKRKQTSALGTPGYAPPEQYQGNADGRSDLYALAATLHHLLTNRNPRNYPPFTYPTARSLNPQLSPDIERVLEHALKINVNERYQNAAAMKHDIDEILIQRFGVDNTSIYIFGMPRPIRTTGTQIAVSESSRFPNTPISLHQPSADGAPPVETQQRFMNLLKRIMNPFNKG